MMVPMSFQKSESMSGNAGSMACPLLSICLPTYNRARLLEKALAALRPEISQQGSVVELVVSDNASTDATRLVLERIAGVANVKVYCNRENVGAARNFDLAVQRANGDFCWIVGDDDLVCVGSAARIVNVLRNYPQVDFAFINAYLDCSDQGEERGDNVAINRPTGEFPVNCADRQSRLLSSWNELIDPRISPVFLGSMMMCVFRRTAWLKGRAGVQFGEPFCSSLSSVYPQGVIFGKEMVGRPAFYVGEPCIIARCKGQEWESYLPVIWAVYLHELLDYYQRQGVEAWRISACRKSLLRVSGPAALQLLFNRKLPGRQCFSLLQYVIRFAQYFDFWVGLCVMPLYKRIHRLFMEGKTPRKHS